MSLNSFIIKFLKISSLSLLKYTDIFICCCNYLILIDSDLHCHHSPLTLYCNFTFLFVIKSPKLYFCIFAPGYQSFRVQKFNTPDNISMIILEQFIRALLPYSYSFIIPTRSNEFSIIWKCYTSYSIGVSSKYIDLLHSFDIP